MNENHSPHAWWSRLRHYGMLLSPVVLVERYPGPPPGARFPLLENLRNDYNRFVSKLADLKENAERDEATILKWVDAILEKYIVCNEGQIAKQHDIRINITAPIRIGNRTETIRPHRVVFADATGTKVAFLVMVDTSSQFGRGRERTAYARFLELLRGSGHRLGLFTNGSQFRLIYAGLDFESWAEWESDRWFDGGDGTEELNGLRQLLSTDSLQPVKSGISGLLDAVEESRKRQADLSSVLRENVRQAVELLLEDVSTAHRTKSDLFTALMESNSERRLTDAKLTRHCCKLRCGSSCDWWFACLPNRGNCCLSMIRFTTRLMACGRSTSCWRKRRDLRAARKFCSIAKRHGPGSWPSSD